MNRTTVRAMVAGMLAVLLQAAPPQKLDYAMGGDPQTLDPGLNQWFRASILLQNLFTGLERMDTAGKPVAGMASSYSLDKSRTVYTFHIADSARWSDGKPLTAQDFEYAWKRVLNPKTASPSSWYLYYLKNGRAANEGKASLDDVGVKAVDARTLKVTLEDPTPYFLDLLCVSAYFPVRKDVVEGPEPWTRNMKTYVTDGPFHMVEASPKDKYVLQKNPDFLYASDVKLDTLTVHVIEASEAQLAAYQTGEIQVFDDPTIEGVKKYQGTPELRVFPRAGMSYYDFNTAKKPFDDARVRRAFSLAINRDQVTRLVLQTNEKPALGFVPYAIPHGVKRDKDYRDVVGNAFTEDVAAARKLLAEAGYAEGKGLPPVTLICQANQQNKDVAQALQAMWKTNLGAAVDIRTIESKVYWSELHAGNFNIGQDSWTADYADPMTNLEIFETNQNVQNNRWSSPEYDALIHANKKLSDQKQRMQNFVMCEKILARDMPVLPAYYYFSRLVCKPNVKGVYKTYLGHTYFGNASVQ